MNIVQIAKTISGISLASLLLAACSGTAGTSVSTGANVEPTSSPQTYVAPTMSPVVTTQTQTNTTADTTTNKPALSTGDDASSIKADLNNTTVSTESFN